MDGMRRWDDDALNHVLCMCYGDTIAFFGIIWAVFVNAGWDWGRKEAGIEVGWLSEWGLLGCGSASGLSNYGCGMAMVSWNLSGGLCDVMHGLFAKNSAGRRRVWVGWTDGMHREGVVLMYG